jgi:hypothetical protein
VAAVHTTEKRDLGLDYQVGTHARDGGQLSKGSGNVGRTRRHCV